MHAGIACWHSLGLGAHAAHGVCTDTARELYIDCCIPNEHYIAMFTHLDDTLNHLGHKLIVCL